MGGNIRTDELILAKLYQIADHAGRRLLALRSFRHSSAFSKIRCRIELLLPA